MGLEYTMTCIDHYNITHNIFTVVKTFCTLPIQPPTQSDFSVVSIILPFPEHLIAGITQYVAFSDWLLLFSSM